MEWLIQELDKSNQFYLQDFEILETELNRIKSLSNEFKAENKWNIRMLIAQKLFCKAVLEYNISLAKQHFDKYKEYSLESMEFLRENNGFIKVTSDLTEYYTNGDIEKKYNQSSNENGYLLFCKNTQNHVETMKNTIDLLEVIEPLLAK